MPVEEGTEVEREGEEAEGDWTGEAVEDKERVADRLSERPGGEEEVELERPGEGGS